MTSFTATAVEKEHSVYNFAGGHQWLLLACATSYRQRKQNPENRKFNVMTIKHLDINISYVLSL